MTVNCAPDDCSLPSFLNKYDLDAIIRLSTHGVWQWDIPSNRYYYCPVYKAMLGYEDDEVENTPAFWQKTLLPDDLPLAQEQLQKHFESKGGHPYTLEARHRHKNGSIVHVRCAGKVVEWTNEGQPSRMVGTHVDITELRNAEIKAGRERDLFERTNAIAQIGAWEVDLQNDTLWWSDQTRIIHEAPSDFTPTLETDLGFYLEEDRAMIRDAVAAAIATNSGYDLELRIRTCKGNIRWVRAVCSQPIDNGNSRVLRGTFQDITNSMVLRLQLERERDFNRNLLSNLNSGFSIIDEEGVLIEVNATLCKMTGYQREELIGCKIPLPYWHPDDITGFHLALQKVESGDMSIYERRFLDKSGGVIWVEITPTILRDPQTGKRFFCYILTDITERIMAEEALKASEMRFKNILEGVETVSVQGYALDGTVRYWNKASTLLYGYTEEEALGRNLLELIIPPAMREAVKAEIRKMVETHQPIPAGELTLMRKDGAPITVYSSHSLVEVPGAEREFFCVNIDLSQRKGLEDALRRAFEKAEAANEAKRQFLANMSHELRTPLNGVLGMTQILLESSLDPEQSQYAKIIESSGEQLVSIIDDIFCFAKLDAGKIEIKKEPFDLPTFIDLIAKEYQLKAADNDLNFEVRKDSDLPQHFRGDATRIRQIITNFLNNAIKFTMKGCITFSAALEVASRPQIRFSVEDTGIGIPNAQADTIFDRFNQVDNSLTRRYGGRGLGLAIAKELVALMGGQIGMQSTEGKGSHFYFSLPIDEPQSGSAANTIPANNPSETQSLPQGEPAASDKKHRVLLAEDNAVNQMVIKAMVESFGAEVKVVGDGQAAMAAIRKTPFDLVLMDLQMPVMDGLEAARLIRKEEREGVCFSRSASKRIPIVAVTAHAFEEDRRKAMDAGMDDYLAKPVRRDQLATLLKRWFP